MGTCAYSFNHAANSLLFSVFKFKIYHKHDSALYAHSSKHSPFKHVRVFHVEASWLDSPSTMNACTPCFSTFFHSIFVYSAFYFCWIISSGETYISEAPGSFVLLWLLVHTVRSPSKASMPTEIATPRAGCSTLTSNFTWIRFLFWIIFLFYGNKAILRLFQLDVFHYLLKKKRKRSLHCSLGWIAICLSLVGTVYLYPLLIYIIGVLMFSLQIPMSSYVVQMLNPQSVLSQTFSHSTFHVYFNHLVLVVFCLGELTTGDQGTSLGTDCSTPTPQLATLRTETIILIKALY